MMKIYKLLIVLLLVGCSHDVLIQSYPPESVVEVNGRYIGKTPVKHELRCKTFGSDPSITLSKEGYYTRRDVLGYEPAWDNIILEFIFFWPAIFINAECPEESYNFRMDKK